MLLYVTSVFLSLLSLQMFSSKYSQKCIFYSWAAVSALHALFVLFRTLLVVTACAVMSRRTNKVTDRLNIRNLSSVNHQNGSIKAAVICIPTFHPHTHLHWHLSPVTQMHTCTCNQVTSHSNLGQNNLTWPVP